jgi:hypothetical protein
MVSRFGLAIGNCQCGCAAYAEDITECWEAFLAEEAVLNIEIVDGEDAAA